MTNMNNATVSVVDTRRPYRLLVRYAVQAERFPRHPNADEKSASTERSGSLVIGRTRARMTAGSVRNSAFSREKAARRLSASYFSPVHIRFSLASSWFLFCSGCKGFLSMSYLPIRLEQSVVAVIREKEEPTRCHGCKGQTAVACDVVYRLTCSLAGSGQCHVQAQAPLRA